MPNYMNTKILSRIAKSTGLSIQSVQLFATGSRPWPKKHLDAARKELQDWREEALRETFNLYPPL